MPQEQDTMVPELTLPAERLHRVLVDEITRQRPHYIHQPFTIAEIYQELVPYRRHRDEIGVEMNGDYEDALLRLLAGAGDLLILESDDERSLIRKELASRNPNTGLFREFSGSAVRLNQARLPAEVLLVGQIEEESGGIDSGANGLGSRGDVPAVEIADLEGEAVPYAATTSDGGSELDEGDALVEIERAPEVARVGDGPDPTWDEEQPQATVLDPHDDVEDFEDVEVLAQPMDVVAVEDLGPDPSVEVLEDTEPEPVPIPSVTAVPTPPRGSVVEFEMAQGGSVTGPDAIEVVSGSTQARSEGVSVAGSCLWCEKELPERDHINYCPWCGTSTQLKPCRACGDEMDVAWGFCVVCGTESADKTVAA